MSRLLITGASSGIGEAIARRMAPTHALILHGRDTDRLRLLQESLPDPERHLLWTQDLAQPGEITQTLSALLRSDDRGVSRFVHCAGEFKPISIAASDPLSVKHQFQVNYFSAAAMIPILLDTSINPCPLQAVVLLSSIATRVGARGYSVYAATKGALGALASSLALQIAPTRINSILPGGVRTPGTAFLYEAMGEAAVDSGYPLGPGSVDDIASLAEFLVSDRARWMTGQSITIDGGKTVGR